MEDQTSDLGTFCSRSPVTVHPFGDRRCALYPHTERMVGVQVAAAANMWGILWRSGRDRLDRHIRAFTALWSRFTRILSRVLNIKDERRPEPTVPSRHPQLP